ncbi:MAG: GET complex subunit get1 [Watsoniomyces obsoletus]|nr:MAG: GET complex subunit get1 [Watsoniomyces obsoletus]
MPSLLIVVFALQLIIHVVSKLGATTLNNTLWDFYNRLPTSTAKGAQEQRRLRRELVRIRQEMNNTSSQDEFAKWAKLRRQHDKFQAELEKTSESLKSTRSMFDSSVMVLRLLSTTGLRFLLQFWFAKQPMFWLPRGWLPWYIEYILAFPKAPRGSISVQVWWLACAAVVQLLGELVMAVWSLQSEEGQVSEKKKQQPMKVGQGAKKEL